MDISKKLLISSGTKMDDLQIKCSPTHQLNIWESHEFTFGKINILRNDLAEIIVNDGADINTEMVDELHNLLLSLFTNSFSLLINKNNSYSTKFNALTQFGQLTAIIKIAVFAPTRMAKLSADFSANIPSSAKLNIQVFSNRDDALDWLEFRYIGVFKAI